MAAHDLHPPLDRDPPTSHSPTTVGLMTDTAGYTGADLRARRMALGLTNTATMDVLLRPKTQRMEAWDRDDHGTLRAVIERIAQLEAIADRITDELAEQGRTTGVIVTYRTDEQAAAAGAEIPVAQVHRICASRAAGAVPDAALEVQGLTDEGTSTAGEKSELLVQLSAMGLSLPALQRAIGINQRVMQMWLSGAEGVHLFPDDRQRIDAVDDASDRHLAVLEEIADRAGVLPLAFTTEELAEIDPAAGIPVETHQMLVGVLLSENPVLRAQRASSWLKEQ